MYLAGSPGSYFAYLKDCFKEWRKWLRDNSLVSYLRNLKRDGIIAAATFRKILPCGSTTGVLYGLPKIHKTGCPFRPIVSSVNTYNYNLASFLITVLKPISTN